ncbi:Apolipoprotein L domain-containing protein 1 [Galemys pyrenaicus]|uniref:Apolipoprotein L domain-containing protein 1 n=1 Tax=Galemys pyrenaicus TaxID=202257 RepID=A0A8J6DMP5_GALPY|nr:Apolipoprotein L domain-containing protein 1 [Galemys pyrenaicus]
MRICPGRARSQPLNTPVSDGGKPVHESGGTDILPSCGKPSLRHPVPGGSCWQRYSELTFLDLRHLVHPGIRPGIQQLNSPFVRLLRALCWDIISRLKLAAPSAVALGRILESRHSGSPTPTRAAATAGGAQGVTAVIVYVVMVTSNGRREERGGRGPGSPGSEGLAPTELTLGPADSVGFEGEPTGSLGVRVVRSASSCGACVLGPACWALRAAVVLAGMEWPAPGELQGADALRRFQGLLLDRRGRLHGQLLRLREAARRLERLRRRSVAAHVAGSSLSAAGAVAAIVGLSLSPVTLGVSLLASAVGLGVATAGGAVTITSDLALIFCNARELRRVQEIAAACQDQMRELLSCLDFLCRRQGRGDPQLLQCGRNASMALYNSVYFVIFFGSRGFLIPRRAEGASRASQAVLRAKIQKLAESLEACTGALDELSEQLEASARLCAKPGGGHDLKIAVDRPAGLFF